PYDGIGNRRSVSQYAFMMVQETVGAYCNTPLRWYRKPWGRIAICPYDSIGNRRSVSQYAFMMV
ncbi:hypothetical protein, partial [Capnocytophaga canis]|uniref:hypothetical protein n=1 Tax=Capnocytophaga canis TaxID=1848903 RepID=UPI00156210C2